MIELFVRLAEINDGFTWEELEMQLCSRRRIAM